MNNIYHSFSNLLNDKQKEFDDKLRKWLSYRTGVEKVKNHRKQFHQWSPLRIYISLGEIKKPKPKFSLRFLGQEVGSISVEANKEPILLISPTHDKHNQKYFAKYYTDTADKFGLPPREYGWNSPESIKFRKDFKKIWKNPEVKPRIPEHRIEAAFIKEMESGKKNESVWKGDEIQPVKVADCPLQMPLPISASKGNPEPKTGHIDILARHRSGKGKRVKLSVWELKSPKAKNNPVNQTYIYALTLRYILRSRHGDDWYKLCGFKSKVPSELVIEAVVAVSEGQEKACRDMYDCLVNINKNPLKVEKDQISFFLALYDKDSLKIKSFGPMMGRERV